MTDPMPAPARSGRHVCVVRLDNDGDVLLAGPAVRAVAAGAREVTLWHGPRGAAAAALLPGVDRLVQHRAEWIEFNAPPVERRETMAFVDLLTALAIDEAVVLTSFHQSALPAALLLRLAGVPAISAISEDYPGSLLDVRHHVEEQLHEVERGLSLVATFGYRLPDGDDARLGVRRPPADERFPAPFDGAHVPYVVVHPGASVPARAWAPQRNAELVDALPAEGWRVAVTGGPGERDLTALVAGRGRSRVVDLGGRTSFAQLADVLEGAAAVVVGNTGPAHLAAAVGTPVVSLFAPTVPAVKWRPWGVAHRLLHVDVACAGCRARECPVAGHPCLGELATSDVLQAVAELAAGTEHRDAPPAQVTLPQVVHQ